MQQGSDKPNVLIILTDDQGYGDMSCHGNPILQTPHIDRLHQESIRFTDFHVAPMCTPSRSQLLTGRDALANGACNVYNGRALLRRGIPTMAEMFAANDYQTGLFGKWHLGDNYPFRPEDRGFQETLWFPWACITAASDYWNNDYFDDHYRHNGVAEQYEGYCTDVFFEEAMQWMQQCHREGEPFFTLLATGADHIPYFVPDHYRDPYRDLNIHLSSFFGMVANFDENLGKLEDMLCQTGLRDNTIVVFMTDNGAFLGLDVYNAGLREGKGSYYEGGHRVPCFIRWPSGGLRDPCDVGDPVQVQDTLPTLIRLCGLQNAPGAEFDGIDLSPALRDEEWQSPDRKMVVQIWEPVKGSGTVIWGPWRLLLACDELYDLRTDPGQEHNIIDEHPEIAEEMRDYYDEWWARLRPDVMELERIRIGSETENPTCLNGLDWRGHSLWFQSQIRSNQQWWAPGTIANGEWRVQVERLGRYEIELRRWPREADAPICGTVPERMPTDRAFVGLEPTETGVFNYTFHMWSWDSAALFGIEGKALPIRQARLRIGNQEWIKEVSADEKAARFTCELEAGPTTLETWFSDERGRELCGAHYVYARRCSEM